MILNNDIADDALSALPPPPQHSSLPPFGRGKNAASDELFPLISGEQRGEKRDRRQRQDQSPPHYSYLLVPPPLSLSSPSPLFTVICPSPSPTPISLLKREMVGRERGRVEEKQIRVAGPSDVLTEDIDLVHSNRPQSPHRLLFLTPTSVYSSR